MGIAVAKSLSCESLTSKKLMSFGKPKAKVKVRKKLRTKPFTAPYYHTFVIGNQILWSRSDIAFLQTPR
jgi:hypothetical protein